MNKYRFKSDERVAFSYGGMDGYGTISGVATTEVPILGVFYTVKVLTSNKELPNDEYPFTTIAMPEIGMIRLRFGKVEQIDDIFVVPILLGDHPICYVKQQYLNALRHMPQPERTIHITTWANEIFDSSELPTKVTLAHLHSLLRYEIERF